MSMRRSDARKGETTGERDDHGPGRAGSRTTSADSGPLSGIDDQGTGSGDRKPRGSHTDASPFLHGLRSVIPGSGDSGSSRQVPFRTEADDSSRRESRAASRCYLTGGVGAGIAISISPVPARLPVLLLRFDGWIRLPDPEASHTAPHPDANVPGPVHSTTGSLDPLAEKPMNHQRDKVMGLVPARLLRLDFQPC